MFVDPPRRSTYILASLSLSHGSSLASPRERETRVKTDGKERAECRTKNTVEKRKTDTCRCKILVLNVYVGLRAHTRPSVNKRMSLDTRVHASPACVEARDGVSGTQREQSRSIAWKLARIDCVQNTHGSQTWWRWKEGRCQRWSMLESVHCIVFFWNVSIKCYILCTSSCVQSFISHSLASKYVHAGVMLVRFFHFLFFFFLFFLFSCYFYWFLRYSRLGILKERNRPSILLEHHARVAFYHRVSSLCSSSFFIQSARSLFTRILCWFSIRSIDISLYEISRCLFYDPSNFHATRAEIAKYPLRSVPARETKNQLCNNRSLWKFTFLSLSKQVSYDTYIHIYILTVHPRQSSKTMDIPPSPGNHGTVGPQQLFRIQRFHNSTRV